MKTPAYRAFINEVGKTVHHLNTIAVGLSGVESKDCTKPEGLDVSWNPADVMASSRDARVFSLKSTIVFVAEELCYYTSSIIASPNIGNVELPKDTKKYQKHEALCKHLGLPQNHLVLGPLLLIHWRNRIIHKNSKADFVKSQKNNFVSFSDTVSEKYKNLCVERLLNDFQANRPTLKDVSSLVAMSINLVKEIENKISEPQSYNDVLLWMSQMGIDKDFDRIQRVAMSKPNPDATLRNFFSTHCPELRESYELYREK